MHTETKSRSAAPLLVDYRVYVLDEDLRIFCPAEFVAAVNDETALEMAARLLVGKVIELWDGTRLVHRHAAESGKAHSGDEMTLKVESVVDDRLRGGSVELSLGQLNR